MSIRKRISLGLGLLAILVILSSTYSLSKNPANSAGLLNNQAPFSAKGPFEVGIRTQVISANTPLEIMVWYPGLVNTTDNSNFYSFEIKFQKPLGRIAIAAYEGHAFIDVPFDFSHWWYYRPDFQSALPLMVGWLNIWLPMVLWSSLRIMQKAWIQKMIYGRQSLNVRMIS
ncbi:MAG: hypothetical protein P8046_13855 [Anaerolineales bacterium]